MFRGVRLTVGKIEQCLEKAVQLNVLERLGSVVLLERRTMGHEETLQTHARYNVTLQDGSGSGNISV